MSSLITRDCETAILKTKQQSIFGAAQLFYTKNMNFSFERLPLNISSGLSVYNTLCRKISQKKQLNSK